MTAANYPAPGGRVRITPPGPDASREVVHHAANTGLREPRNATTTRRMARTNKMEGTDTQAGRLIAARKAAGYDRAEDAIEKFGWSKSSYTQHECGARGLKNAAEKYATAYGVDPAWMLDGDPGRAPPWYADPTSPAPPAAPTYARPTCATLPAPNGASATPVDHRVRYDPHAPRHRAPVGGDVVSVPENVYSAGAPNEPLASAPFTREFIERELRVAVDAAELLRVSQDVRPEVNGISRGDWMIIDTSLATAHRAGVYALRTSDGGVAFRRVSPMVGLEPPHSLVTSDTPSHTHEVPTAALHVIGRVVWIGKKV